MVIGITLYRRSWLPRHLTQWLKSSTNKLCAANRCISGPRYNHTDSSGNLPKAVPGHIQRPPYAEKGFWFLKNNYGGFSNKIQVKSGAQIQGMRAACAVARAVLAYAGSLVQFGITTDGLDSLVHQEIINSDAYPSPLMYKGFPKSICTSVNNVACHGIPDDTVLCDGDIINIDVTVYYKGFHGDCSETFIVGETSAENEWLIETTRQCRDLAIEKCGPGVPFSVIGQTVYYKGFHGDCSETFIVGETSAENEWLIETTRQCRDLAIEKCGPGVPFSVIGQTVNECADEWKFNIVSQFCGHGIGEAFHEQPQILHVYNDDTRLMQPGMTFTIEPILAEGGSEVHMLADGWTAVTDDHSTTAQCEHTLLITDHGAQVLT